MSSAIGWELLYSNIKNDVKRKNDILTAIVHLTLVKSGFRCTGLELKNSELKENEGSELLPPGWNAKPDGNVEIYYKFKDANYILRSCEADNNMIFNFMRNEPLKVVNTVFKVEEIVRNTQGNLSDIIPNYDEAIEQVKKDLIGEYIEPCTSNANTQTNPLESPSPLIVGSSSSTTAAPRYPQSTPSPLLVGEADKDPLIAAGYRPGGGMLFDPFRNRNPNLDPGLGPFGPIPRPPPGARFDPFGPPDNAIRPRRQPHDFDFPPGFM